MKFKFSYNPDEKVRVTQTPEGLSEITLWDGWHKIGEQIWEGEIYHIERDCIPYHEELADEIAANFGVWVKKGKMEEAESYAEIERINRKAILDRRKELLSECDYTQMPDYPISDVKRVAWAKYRQALRDITKQPEYPGEIKWPIAPS